MLSCQLQNAWEQGCFHLRFWSLSSGTRTISKRPARARTRRNRRSPSDEPSALMLDLIKPKLDGR